MVLLQVHFMKIHKGTPPVKRHECVICGQKFHKPVYLRNHLMRHKDMSYSGTGGQIPAAVAAPTMPPGAGRSMNPSGGNPSNTQDHSPAEQGSPSTSRS